MPFIAWKVPVHADWAGSLRLETLACALPDVSLVIGHPDATRWRLSFDHTRGLRITARAHAAALLNRLPYSGALFESIESAWIRELELAMPARHFVLCCEREVVEVVAAACRVDAAT